MRRKQHNLGCDVRGRRSRRRHGDSAFTLVEILIVIIILGILATIVVPQFIGASQDARRSSLASQVQTLRAQIDLYRLQHMDENPPGLDTAGSVVDGATAWAELLIRTDVDHTPNGAGKYGPYLQTLPLNPMSDNPPSDSCDVYVVGADVTPGAASGAGTAGWVYNRNNGKLWATSKSGGFVYDEVNPQAAVNTQ